MDAQDYWARVATVLSSTIASVPTRISQYPLPGSWITSNSHPIIKRVCFRSTASRAVYPVYPVHPCSTYSPSRLIFPVAGPGCAQRPDSRSASRAAASGPINPVPWVAAQFPCDAAPGHPVGGNRMDRPKQSPGAVAGRAGWRRWNVVPGLVRAGRPRSRVGFIP